MNTLQSKKILLIISGGIAAYKSLELIRLLKKAGAGVRCILTQGGAKFITPLSVSALSGEQTHTDLWSLKDETEMGHIRLSRESDLIVVAPASASFIAKMAFGLADDLGTAALLAADKPVLVAPAMNHMMWNHPATQENIGTLMRRGVKTAGPCAGDMACGETGIGRMAEPEEILTSIRAHFERAKKLSGLRALVTSGPTFEPIDPVRFIGNRSSGKQGHAIAAALASCGADVTLVSGPTALPDPASVKTIHVETADEMISACRAAAPADIAICAAAVADWKPAQTQKKKIKKDKNAPPTLTLTENPDILSALAQPGPRRPRLVIGFAAETENILESAHAKRMKKKCDWIVANNVGTKEKIFGSDGNHVHLITASGQMEWRGSKKDIADRLVLEIMDHFKNLKLSEAAE
ncbi:MAG: bifunctional phosphopantothenoylcysteine decarboxylase/phosphopantothenate--cysteine ligase CoaBC [Proteobacteria bacterium]|nr:bifunctional phosphopantothenoylcysteine decarboxylase/phosphopantothenate--cysteine ligase CoaBC [Pseudomonadota bacterium]